MRKITAGPIACFLACLAAGVLAAGWVASSASAHFPLGNWAGPVAVLLFLVLLFVLLAAQNRLLWWWRPLPEGDIAEGSREEFFYHLNLLFYLLAFYPVTRSKFVPVPLMRLVYQLLGARLGANTYCSGTILDPRLTVAGHDTILGQDCVLYSHAIEGRHLALAAIRIGNNVTVGANAVIMSGVTIGDGAIVAAGSVVTKGTAIGPGEVWGGVPARKIRDARSELP